MKAYLNFFKLRILTALQYRADALAGVLTQFFFGIIQVLVYVAFYESSKSGIAPMKLSELITYVWLMQAFFSIIFPYQRDKELIAMIKNGNLAYELVRPQNFFIKYFIKMYAGKIARATLRCLPVLIIGFLLPAPYNLCLPKSSIHLLLFALGLIIGGALLSAMIILVHIITMFTIDSRGTICFYSTIVDIFAGSCIPIPFFPGILKKIAMILPFRYITDFPFRIYSGSITLETGWHYLIASLIWTIITFIFGLVITKLAFRKAVIQGG